MTGIRAYAKVDVPVVDRRHSGIPVMVNITAPSGSATVGLVAVIHVRERSKKRQELLKEAEKVIGPTLGTIDRRPAVDHSIVGALESADSVRTRVGSITTEPISCKQNSLCVTSNT